MIVMCFEQRAKLKDELSTQMAEANTFRALPSSVSMSFPVSNMSTLDGANDL